MKKIFSVLAIVALAACNSGGTKTDEVKPADSTAVAPATTDNAAPAKTDSTMTAKPDSAAAAK